MKTALPPLLLAMILAGCAVPDNRCFRHTAELQENAPQVEQDSDHPARELRDEIIFPHVVTTYRQFSLSVIETYCKRIGMRALGKNRVRLFIQPMGVVANAFEIDLVNQLLSVYPGTHGDEEIVHILLDEAEVAQVRELVASPEFNEIPSDNQKIGRNGTSYMVEASINDAYHWVLHWSPDDDVLIRIVERISALATKKTEPEAGGYRR